MAILVGWFLALDKDYAVRAKLATQKSPEMRTGEASFLLKGKQLSLKIFTSKCNLSGACQIN
jgi:hypothetical protein